jgi:RibD C-terminal domain
VIRDFLAAGLVDHAHIVVVPILLGRGVRLWCGLEGIEQKYRVETTASPSGVTHLTFTRAGARTNSVTDLEHHHGLSRPGSAFRNRRCRSAPGSAAATVSDADQPFAGRDELGSLLPGEGRRFRRSQRELGKRLPCGPSAAGPRGAAP